MNATPKGNRLHVGLFGRRNVGKSSLLNALTRQQVSLVSDVAGTTTDPVEKPMELPPLGPVLFIDTAGLDDMGGVGDLGDLGERRVARTRQVFDRTDLGILVASARQWGPFEEALVAELRGRKLPVVVAFNRADEGRPDADLLARLKAAGVAAVSTVAPEGQGIPALREALLRAVPEDFLAPPALLADLVPPGGLAVLVVPIDMEAPRGRLILPQVQAIRDLLDHQATCLVVRDRELRPALGRLREPPDLVVTDSQAFLRVAADTPPGVPLTSFSILFARNRGDLTEFVRGALAIDDLKAGDRVLVCEACTHHPVGDDIGRVKIPRWLRQYVGGSLTFDHVQGHDFPADLAGYNLVVHCGGCVQNRREMLARQARCRAAAVPMTNYGVTIAYTLGLFERALTPFPAAREAYQALARAGGRAARAAEPA